MAEWFSSASLEELMGEIIGKLYGEDKSVQVSAFMEMFASMPEKTQMEIGARISHEHKKKLNSIEVATVATSIENVVDSSPRDDEFARVEADDMIATAKELLGSEEVPDAEVFCGFVYRFYKSLSVNPVLHSGEGPEIYDKLRAYESRLWCKDAEPKLIATLQSLGGMDPQVVAVLKLVRQVSDPGGEDFSIKETFLQSISTTNALMASGFIDDKPEIIHILRAFNIRATIRFHDMW